MVPAKTLAVSSKTMNRRRRVVAKNKSLVPAMVDRRRGRRQFQLPLCRRARVLRRMQQTVSRFQQISLPDPASVVPVVVAGCSSARVLQGTQQIGQPVPAKRPAVSSKSACRFQHPVSSSPATASAGRSTRPAVDGGAAPDAHGCSFGGRPSEGR